MRSSPRRAQQPADVAPPASASRRLLWAILERAIRDAVGPLGTGSTACTPIERKRVRGWFRSSDAEPMSFRWLCAVLDIEPGAIVRRLALPDERTEGRAVAVMRAQ